MPKIRLGDMTTQDKKNYQYYKRLRSDFYLYGPQLMQKIAKEEIEKIENKYERAEESAED